eukprot:m.928778 g.928778  ORF g.928778 m.928778 type:complete len:312 (-) comp23780_c0_seq1:482-1417(-)
MEQPTTSAADTCGLKAHFHIENWRQENKDLFNPPVCNKLMFKEQLNVMFVGGPNIRTDFHLDLGSEFFFQFKGNMELPTIQRGKRKLVKIKEGQVYLLPSRIPHSPQRPEEDSFGLVIERSREPEELDGLRWYTDFDSCEQILWEKYFHCGDLGRDLVPVVQEFKASNESITLVPGSNVLAGKDRPWHQDIETEVPDPIFFEEFINAHSETLGEGGIVKLFEKTPDKEFDISVCGGPTEYASMSVWKYDTWLFQYKGHVIIRVQGKGDLKLNEGCCVIIPPELAVSVKRSVAVADKTRIRLTFYIVNNISL